MNTIKPPQTGTPSIKSTQSFDQAPAESTPSPSPKKKKALVFVALFITVSIAALGFLVLQNCQLKKQATQSSQKATPTTTPEKHIDPSNNKTLHQRGEDGYFTIEIPSNWTIQQFDGPYSTVVIKSPNKNGSGQNGGNLEVLIGIDIKLPAEAEKQNVIIADQNAVRIIDGSTITFYLDNIYWGYKQADISIQIVYYLNDPDYETLQEIISTIKFNPEIEELEGAVKIDGS